jgi:hypothetical protein
MRYLVRRFRGLPLFDRAENHRNLERLIPLSFFDLTFFNKKERLKMVCRWRGAGSLEGFELRRNRSISIAYTDKELEGSGRDLVVHLEAYVLVGKLSLEDSQSPIVDALAAAVWAFFLEVF